MSIENGVRQTQRDPLRLTNSGLSVQQVHLRFVVKFWGSRGTPGNSLQATNPGNAGRPGGLPLEDTQPLIVLRALAHGVNKPAKLNGKVIRRRSAPSHMESPLALKKTLNGKSAGLSPSDYDILYIPSGMEKILSYCGIKLAEQTTAGVTF